MSDLATRPSLLSLSNLTAVCLGLAAFTAAGCATPRPGSSDAATGGAAEEARAPAAAPPPGYELQRRIIADSYRPAAGPAGVRVAFFDADSTLRVAPSGSVSANGPTDVMILPNVGSTLRRLAGEGYLIAIVSNQGGVAAGILPITTADQALAHTARLIRQAGGEVHYFDFAESNEGEDRKPGIGMAKRLDAELRRRFGPRVGIDRARSLMVGDSAYKVGADQRPGGAPGTHFSNADRMFAQNAGLPFHEPADFFGWRAGGVDVFLRPTQVREFEVAKPRPPGGGKH